ncbi:MAG: hypothetical protein ACOYVJ_09090 [Nitrospirota bacterium]
MNDGQDEDFFREEKTGAGLLLSPKNILFILKNPVILSSIMYIRSDRMHRILDRISGWEGMNGMKTF